jgi:hypothetical protein
MIYDYYLIVNIFKNRLYEIKAFKYLIQQRKNYLTFLHSIKEN